MPKTPRKAPKPAPPAPLVEPKVLEPSEGFKGEPPEYGSWFPTNLLIFNGGKLHQLHKRNASAETDGETVWWWFPVDSI